MKNIFRITALIILLAVAGSFVAPLSVFAAVGNFQKCKITETDASGGFLQVSQGNCDVGLKCNVTYDGVVNPDGDPQIGICLASLPEGPQAGTDILLIINRVSNWVFGILLALGVIYLVLAAFQFVMGGPEKVSEARQKLLYAVIGISLALVANGVDDVLRRIINP